MDEDANWEYEQARAAAARDSDDDDHFQDEPKENDLYDESKVTKILQEEQEELSEEIKKTLRALSIIDSNENEEEDDLGDDTN